MEFIVKRSDLNLSTRPFPAYRLVNLALFLVFGALLVLSVWQVYGFVRFSSMARNIRDENEIGFLNGLIVRRDLSWTRLFGNLEEMVPDSVHLISLRPDVAPNGSVTLHLDVVGRSIADVSRFIEALEKSPEFENVIVSVEQKEPTAGGSDVNITLTANYFPQRETR